MNWSVFATTFGLIFVAELGDKTQLAIVTQTCKYGRPLPVFLGGSIALTAVTAVAVVGGQVLGNLVPEIAIRIAASLAFVIMGGLVWRESTRLGDNAIAEEDDGDQGDVSRLATGQRSPWDWKAFGTTLSLLFLAELGDKTQLAVLGLTFKQLQPWTVFAAGALALTSITALGVLGGQQLSRIVPHRLLLRVSAVVFVVMGVIMGLGVL